MLTTKKIESLKPKNRQYKVQDMSGLYLIVTPKGAKSFRYNYRLNSIGKYQTKTYGLFPALNLSQARLAHAEFREELESGISRTFKKFDESFMDWYKQKFMVLETRKLAKLLLIDT